MSWVFETLDGHRSGPHGEAVGQSGSTSATVLYKGRPHVFYYDEGNGNLRHGYWNGSYWAFETLDGHGNGLNGETDADVGIDPSTVLEKDRPVVFFHDLSEGDLRRGRWTGSVWEFQTIDGHIQGDAGHGETVRSVGRSSSIVIQRGVAHVFDIDTTRWDLRHASILGLQ